MKVCTKCGIEKSEDEFYRYSPAAGGGLRAECKLCFNERPRNKERERNNLRAWRAQNPEATKAQGARYREAHRTERRALNHQRRAMNRIMTEDDLIYLEILGQDPCAYCGLPTEHVDHIDTLSLSPDPHWDNLTAACGSCNRRKSDKKLLAFLGDR